MTDFYVTMFVGCIECGVPTKVVGVYSTHERATNARDEVARGGDSWARFGGQGYCDVFGPLALGVTLDPGSREDDDG